MAESPQSVQLILEDYAREAITDIASMLGGKPPEEAVERALGTERYLLKKVTADKAKIFIIYDDGSRAEVNLFG